MARGTLDYMKRIYIIEDNPSLQEIYQENFEKAGWTVGMANNGLEALTALPDFKADVILLDLLMPELDGFEFLTLLKNNTSIHAKVIVNSNLSTDEDIQKAMKLGATAYVRKSDFTGLGIVGEVVRLLNMHS